jgi:phage terminase large subunit
MPAHFGKSCGREYTLAKILFGKSNGESLVFKWYRKFIFSTEQFPQSIYKLIVETVNIIRVIRQLFCRCGSSL